ncbi:ATP-binding protein [Actinoplanes siamensis]|uniref:Histidine kinase/HSP90-like ATPase domain-containing protein n=1 Tax=Actinoplanes siamensis TaxID=1223317 RepID=A0A919N202_9ACTN|nr:ATP-binding protein [Actinoplanes siamensis]GIF02801.1 hypothetical protein Asi03nite_03390 [Actinoplanes siamensis]
MTAGPSVSEDRRGDVRAGADRDRTVWIRQARAVAADAAALRERALAAVSSSVATMSVVASRHGGRLPLGVEYQHRDRASCVFTIGGLGAARQRIAEVARSAGMPEEDLDGFVLAVQELMTNAIRHGGGWGRVRVHRDGAVLVCTVTDRGPGVHGDPDGWATLPSPESEGGRGLFLARAMTHSLRVSAGPGGTAVTVTMNLPDPPSSPAPS